MDRRRFLKAAPVAAVALPSLALLPVDPDPPDRWAGYVGLGANMNRSVGVDSDEERNRAWEEFFAFHRRRLAHEFSVPERVLFGSH